MERVMMNKAELLAAVKKNRAAHAAFFEEAVEGYRKKISETISAMKRVADANKDIDTSDLFRLRKPESHVKDYDRVISMLSQHTKAEVELSNEDFGRYFEDDWEWKQNWLNANSAYTARVG